MKCPQRRLALGIDTFLCLLVVGFFGNTIDVVPVEPKASCPQEDSVDSSQDYKSLGAKYLKQAKYKLAQQCFEKWLSQLERNPKAKKLDLAIALGNVGWSLQAQGENSQAIPFWERSLVLLQAEPGFEKEKLIFWFADLAAAKQQIGEYEDAEKLLKSAVSISEKSFGRDSIQFALILNNLGGYYLAARKIDKAAATYKEALSIDERTSGKSSIAVGRDLCNIAECYREQGKLREAEPLFKRSLAILDKTGDSEKGESAFVCSNLGLLYFAQGRYSLAERHYKCALRIRITLLGARSPYVGLTLTNYAILLRKTGRIAEALKLEERARATYPFDQSQVCDEKIAKLDRNAWRSFDERDFTSAIGLFRESLALSRERKPPSSKQFARRLRNLASAFRESGDHLQAEKLLKQCIELRQHAANATNLEIACYSDLLALNFDAQGRYAEAQSLYAKSLAMAESGKVYCKGYLSQAFTNLGNVCMRQGKYREATGYYIRAQSLSEKDLGPDNSNLPWILNNLAFCYQKQGNYQAAEPLYTRALRIRRKIKIFLYPSIATIEENYKSLIAVKN